MPSPIVEAAWVPGTIMFMDLHESPCEAKSFLSFLSVKATQHLERLDSQRTSAISSLRPIIHLLGSVGTMRLLVSGVLCLCTRRRQVMKDISRAWPEAIAATHVLLSKSFVSRSKQFSRTKMTRLCDMSVLCALILLSISFHGL